MDTLPTRARLRGAWRFSFVPEHGLFDLLAAPARGATVDVMARLADHCSVADPVPGSSFGRWLEQLVDEAIRDAFHESLHLPSAIAIRATPSRNEPRQFELARNLLFGSHRGDGSPALLGRPDEGPRFRGTAAPTPMSEQFWTSVLAVGLAQGAFLAGALFLQRATNRRASRTLAFVVCFLTLILLGELLEQLLAPQLALLVVCLNLHTELALGPLALLFVLSIVDPDRPRRGQELLHFLPLLIGWTVGLVLWVTLRHRPAPLDEPGWLTLTAGYVLFKAVFFYSYLIVALRTLARALREPLRFTVGRRPVGLRWLQRWLVGIGAAPGVIYASVLLERVGIDPGFEPDRIGSLVLAAMIYLASSMVLLRPWVLSLTSRRAEGRWSEASARLTTYLERERPWLDSELALGDLARALGLTENRLSTLLNDGLGTTFYELLTRYRLSEFEQLARDPALRHRSVLDLAFEAGFNSKASFYRAFREAHGTTPTEFRSASAEDLQRFSSQRAQRDDAPTLG